MLIFSFKFIFINELLLLYLKNIIIIKWLLVWYCNRYNHRHGKDNENNNTKLQQLGRFIGVGRTESLSYTNVGSLVLYLLFLYGFQDNKTLLKFKKIKLYAGNHFNLVQGFWTCTLTYTSNIYNINLYWWTSYSYRQHIYWI